MGKSYRDIRHAKCKRGEKFDCTLCKGCDSNAPADLRKALNAIRRAKEKQAVMRGTDIPVAKKDVNWKYF